MGKTYEPDGLAKRVFLLAAAGVCLEIAVMVLIVF